MATRKLSKKAYTVWNKAKKIIGKDPKQYRQDPYGKKMCRSSYGKDSLQGWQVDHITPKSRGGSNATRNLQALNTKINRQKSNSLVKRSRHNQG